MRTLGGDDRWKRNVRRGEGERRGGATATVTTEVTATTGSDGDWRLPPPTATADTVGATTPFLAGPVESHMADLQTISDEIRRIREDTNASREVRQNLQSIEEALAGMASDDAPGAYLDRFKEIRAELDRLSDDAEGQTAVELDRLREEVREYEREGA